ncbi:MAG TPA: site-specific integrase [Bryobacteraceae bacterium]|nr:site-specific integrase [Bryobacteraceae bacterium]
MQLAEAVESFLSGYFATCRRSAKTKSAYSIDLAQFKAQIGSSAALECIEPPSLESWAGALTGDGYTPASVRRKFATLKVFF